MKERLNTSSHQPFVDIHKNTKKKHPAEIFVLWYGKHHTKKTQ
jgi:hypothetical protein